LLSGSRLAAPLPPMPKNRGTLLKPNWPLLVFRLPRSAARAPFKGPAETGADGVRACSYPSCSMEDLAMRTYDFTPLWRSTIGFDRFFDLVDAAQHAGSDDNYPPCNVERLGEDRYQISLALAGFAPDEIAITAEQNVLTVEGQKAEKQQREFLYQGISSRPFKRQFNLADYVQVKGAAFDNGLLQIELVREIPEAMKPRRIAIGTAPASDVRHIDTKAA
jgi:molecular chaperone IbpA